MKSTEEKLEKLAEIQHEIWSHWMNWMFENGGFHREDGRWIMKSAKVKRWKKQANTQYAELSESEKQSDRDVVKKHGIEKLFIEQEQEIRKDQRKKSDEARKSVFDNTLVQQHVVPIDLDKLIDDQLK